jgi:hypothetical protein
MDLVLNLRLANYEVPAGRREEGIFGSDTISDSGRVGSEKSKIQKYAVWIKARRLVRPKSAMDSAG